MQVVYGCHLLLSGRSETSSTQGRLSILADVLSDQVGMVYDLFPAVLSVTGIESKELLDGVDLSSFLEEELSK